MNGLDFRERQVVGIGWAQLAKYAKPNMTRDQLTQYYLQIEPNTNLGTARSGASQVWRFINEIQPEDWVITYSPANRTYLIGKILSDFQYHPEWIEEGMALARTVKWEKEIGRDTLSEESKNTLGSTLTVFQLPKFAIKELLHDKIIINIPVEHPNNTDIDDDPLLGMEALAIERIKDLVSALQWDEMHRSTIPLTLWTLDDVVRTLIEYYDHVDIETKLLVPLKRAYLPV